MPIAYQDERLTTTEVAGQRARGKPIDDLAAAAILQRYIDALERGR